MLSCFRRFLLMFSIVFSVGLEAGAAPPPTCNLGPARSAPSAPDVTSSLSGQSALLDFIASVNTPGTARFAAADYFREHQPAGQLQITWIGQNFREHFLTNIEGDVLAGELDIHRLRRSAHDGDIIAELGKQTETTLHDVWTLLGCQPQGEKGVLLTDTTPNVFYVRETTGMMWAVDLVWGGAGWEIGASSLDDPRPWRFGRQIISRRP